MSQKKQKIGIYDKKLELVHGDSSEKLSEINLSNIFKIIKFIFIIERI